MRSTKIFLLLVVVMIGALAVVVFWRGPVIPTRRSPPFTTINHNLAVIVPFRERFSDLMIFLPHMADFLTSKGVPHTFYVINQVDNYRFNRGMLLNVGVKESEVMETQGAVVSPHSQPVRLPASSMIALHDVDLLPLDRSLKYEYLGSLPHHVIPSWLHPIYHYYANYLGGIMLISRETFARVDGFSNRFWGWGREDDEFGRRLKDMQIKVLTEKKSVPTQPKFKHIHSKMHKRETVPFLNPITHLRDRVTGLHSIKYNVTSRIKIAVSGVDAWITNVQLYCDPLETPYCIDT
ncbi:Beta-1,4-galactosyltransferase 7 [Sparganum proliferum]